MLVALSTIMFSVYGAVVGVPEDSQSIVQHSHARGHFASDSHDAVLLQGDVPRALYTWHWITSYDAAIALPFNAGYLYRVELTHGWEVNSLYLVGIDNNPSGDLAATLYYTEFLAPMSASSGLLQTGSPVATVQSTGSSAAVRAWATGAVANGGVNTANRVYYVYIRPTSASVSNLALRGVRVECRQ